ncbi:MAG: indole-3-glycerol phosphate synthase TrpC [Mariprofundaceae bacterium]|nr:indole-3-glycerol phosphate synthase TrpC [Mariprofundaceae bacterium]
MSSILDQIAQDKRLWVKKCKQQRSEQSLLHASKDYNPLDFTQALQDNITTQQTTVIAEVKKASPSKGLIREDFDPTAIAQAYQKAGATCLSVLTDQPYFQGSDTIFREVRACVELPLLRKDFMLDPYQVIEARVLGADCILIIMAMVDDTLAAELSAAAKDMGLSVLVEVHNHIEMKRAMRLELPLLGINNRDLHTFDTSLDTTINMLQDIPSDKTIITESGIHHPKDIQRMQDAGVYGFLIGESLMRQANVEQALKALLLP